MQKSKILIVDDEPFVVNALKKELGRHYDVDGYTDPEEALDQFKPNEFDVAILDVRMPKMNGVELASKIRLKDPDLPILFFTGYTDPEAMNWLHGTKDTYRVPKPWANDLELLVERVIETQRNKTYFNALLRDTIEIFRLGTEITEDKLTEIKDRMNALPSFASVEIYEKDPSGRFYEIETGKYISGLKDNMVETVYSSKEPRILKENGKWVWGTNFGRYVVLVYLRELSEEAHNYLQLLREIFTIGEKLRCNLAYTEKLTHWLIKANWYNIENQIHRIFSHQVNNYLGAIIGNADYALVSGTLTDARKSLENILRAAQEIAAIIEKCRNCGCDPEEPGGDFKRGVQRCIEIFKNEIEQSGIELSVDFPTEIYMPFSLGEWEQIMINALLIGLGSMKNGGKIEFAYRSLGKADELKIRWNGYKPRFENIDDLPSPDETDRFRFYIITKLAEKYGCRWEFKSTPHPELTINLPKVKDDPSKG